MLDLTDQSSQSTFNKFSNNLEQKISGGISLDPIKTVGTVVNSVAQSPSVRSSTAGVMNAANKIGEGIGNATDAIGNFINQPLQNVRQAVTTNLLGVEKEIPQSKANMDDQSNQEQNNPDPNNMINHKSSIPNTSGSVNMEEMVGIEGPKGEQLQVKRSELPRYGINPDGSIPGQQNNQTAETLTGSNQDPNDQQDPMQGLTADKLYKASQMAAMNGDIKSANQLGAMYARAAKYETSQSPKRGKLTGGQLKELSDIQNSISQMQTATDLVGSYTEKMGPFQGQIGSANKYDTDSQTFQSGMEAIAQQVGKAMEGGVLRAEDVPKYKKMLPQITDTPQVAKNKILQVQKLLNSQLSIKQQIYGDYDVAEGIDTTDPNSVNGMQFMQ